MKIDEFFSLHKRVVVAVSGGVDSAVLLHLAKRYAKDVIACFVKSDFQPEFELEDAVKICNDANVKLKIIYADVFESNEIISNPNNRCYYCKKLIFSKTTDYAKSIGAEVVEGTNASDDVDDRPGYKALGELGILSPLKLCGVDKMYVRKYAAKHGISVADKPSYACLATRIPTGTAISKEILKVTEFSENELFKLGFKDFRIRYYNGSAKLQLSIDDMKRLFDKRAEVLGTLKPYYNKILLDLEVRDNE